MKRIFILLPVLIAGELTLAQQAPGMDSLKKELASAVTDEKKVEILDLLARGSMNVSLADAEDYGRQLITIAEESRDRKLMIKAYMSNGTRCGYFSSMREYANRALDYYNRALEIAKENRLDEETGAAYLRLSAIQLAIPDKEMALNYANKAFSVISVLKNDSLLAEANIGSANVYLARNDKILALRHYLGALRIAEDLKQPSLIRSCYLNLSNFYSSIEDYDRAIDYFTDAFRELDKMQEKNVPYQRVVDINNLGKLYAAKKNYDIAISYFQKSLAMADSLKFANLKTPAYLSLLNQYLRMKEPKKALDYFNSPDGTELKKFLGNFHLNAAIDQAYGVIYSDLNQFDSAKFYFGRAADFIEKSSNETSRMSFYAQLGSLYEKTEEYKKAIELYGKAKEIAERTSQLEEAASAAKHLDTLYNKSGEFQKASYFNSVYYKYKDSIAALNKEKELAQVEAVDEQYRLKKQEDEKAELIRRKNNIQYMAITIGIAAFFVLLVVMGMFRVSANTIRAIGFFAFLLFFEFIFLIFKKNIYGITHGEPLKDLTFMIGLAALLVPLHHWLEHKVIKYLTSHNRLTASGKNILSKVFIRKKDGGDKSKA